MELLAIAALLVGALNGCGKAPPVAGPTPTGSPVASSPLPVVEVDLTPGKIKEGVGLEGVSLGDSKAQVEKVFGKPEAEDANEFAPGQTYALYYSKGVELSFSKDILEVITLHSTNDKWSTYTGGTSKGLGVGSLASRIVKELGEPQGATTPRALRYPKLGLWFRLDADRGPGTDPRAESLQVMRPE